MIEEADESLFWLEFLVHVELVPRAAVQSHLSEADELVRIFTAAQKTARSRGTTANSRRPKQTASFAVPD